MQDLNDQIISHEGLKYHLIIRWFLWLSLPVVFRQICQNAVDTEVSPVSKQSFAVGAILGLVSCPVVTKTGQAVAVSTWYRYWAVEDVSTQSAKEVLLGKEADGGGHYS